MNIGLFGGTFDPPHIGHLLIAEQAMEQLKLDAVYFIPACVPPHKMHGMQSAPGHRWRMLNDTIRGNKRFHASRYELQQEGISYTVKTVCFFHNQYPDAQLFVILGYDNYKKLATWKSPETILKLATLAVYHRSGAGRVQPVRRKRALALQGGMFDISSTMIRSKCKNGESIRYFVVPAVERYIQRHRLYSPKNGE